MSIIFFKEITNNREYILYIMDVKVKMEVNFMASNIIRGICE